jgi:hypothetical protein
VSEHNVWCDDQCKKQAELIKAEIMKGAH